MDDVLTDIIHGPVTTKRSAQRDRHEPESHQRHVANPRPLAAALPATRSPAGQRRQARHHPLLLWGWATIDNFLSTANVNAILYSVAAVGIAAVGMAFITLSGNLFMLSMGATAAVSTIIFASTLHLGLPATPALVVIFGAIVGLFQGVVVGWAGANPIIATIAISSIIMGAGALYSGGLTIVGQGTRPGSVSEASPASSRTRSCCFWSSRSSPRSSSSGPASVESCG